MKPINLTKGQEVFIGRPAKPLPASVENKFKTALHELPAAVEVHLPQVQATISDSFPPDFYIDVWPLTESDTILKEIRAATMRIK